MATEVTQIHVLPSDLALLRATAQQQQTTINKLINRTTVEYLAKLGVK